MKNFRLVSQILRESEESVAPEQNAPAPTDIKNDPEILQAKKQAEIIKAKAELMGAQNKVKQVQFDRAKIHAQIEDHQKELAAKEQQPTQSSEGM